MNLFNTSLITLFALFLTGCSDAFPLHHGYTKEIVFVKGKPYLIPHGTLFNTTPIKEEVTVNDYRTYGHTPCQKGDITWISPKTAKALKETYRINGADAFSYAYGEAIRTKKTGCARPLSQREYDYYHTTYGL